MLCIQCSKEVTGKRAKTKSKFCSPRCYQQAYNDTNNATVVHHENFVNIGTTGAYAELLVSADLLRQGYEVFRSVSPNTSCDLIAMRNKICYRVEVKSGYMDTAGNVRCTNNLNENKFDILAIVYLDTIQYEVIATRFIGTPIP